MQKTDPTRVQPGRVGWIRRCWRSIWLTAVIWVIGGILFLFSAFYCLKFMPEYWNHWSYYNEYTLNHLRIDSNGVELAFNYSTGWPVDKPGLFDERVEHQWLGFGYFHRTCWWMEDLGGPHQIWIGHYILTVPHWFFSLVGAILLYWAWKRTRRNARVARGFAVIAP